MKLSRKNSIMAVFASVICSLCMLTGSAYAAQGTEGNELQLLEPQNLEIQLGEAWVGTEFSLKTDAGLYPDNIAVGGDGVLRMEIGGSKSYILSCKTSNQDVKPISETQEPEAGTESEVNDTENKSISSIQMLLIVAIIAVIAILAIIGNNRPNKPAEQNDETSDK